MKLKYYLRGLGIGIIVTTMILAISFSRKGNDISDEEVMARAAQLGMVMPDDTIIKETEKNEFPSQTDEAQSEAALQKKETESQTEAAEKPETEKKTETAQKQPDVEKKTEVTEKQSETENKTETASKQSETDKKPEVADKKTEAADKKTETADKKTEAVEKKTETADKKSEAADKKTETANKKSEAADEKPETADKKPEATEKNTAVTDKNSEETQPATDKQPETTIGTANSKVYRLTVKKGDVCRTVCEDLAANGLIEDSEVMRKYLGQIGYASAMSIGEYDIPYGLSMEEIGEVLKKGPIEK